MPITKKLLSLGLLAANLCTALAAEPADWKVSKKLLYFGWGDITPSFLNANITEMEKHSPFDGVGIIITGQGDVKGKKTGIISRYAFSTLKWKYEWFESDVKILKNIKFKQFSDNFIRASTLPGDVEWFDDKGWDAVCNNFMILAKIAKETGCKGIQYDPEYYPNPLPEYCDSKIGQAQFQYNPASGKSFEESCDKARERGQQLISAMGKEFPQIKLLMFYSFSECYRQNFYDNPFTMLRYHVSGLYASFLNGLYDGMMPEMTFIEGSEFDGYVSKNPAFYYRALARYHKMTKIFLDRKNHAKLSRTQFAPALYMDAYFPSKSKTFWDILPDVETENVKPRLSSLETNLETAFDISDEYVWVWGEQGKWWGDDKFLKFKAWQEKIPGITQVMRRAKNQLDFALKNDGAEKNPNLLPNGDFEKPALKISQPDKAAPVDVRESTIPNWSIWQQKPPAAAGYGNFELINGKGYNGSVAVLASNFATVGSLVSFTKVIPGKRYLVKGKMLSEGNAAAYLSITWRTGSPPVWYRGDVLAPDIFVAPKPIENSDWKSFEIVVKVPENATEMGVQPSVIPQKNEKDKIYFDDLGIYQLE